MLHLCLARKLFLLAGFDRLMVIVGSPNRTVLTRPVLGLRTLTADFFDLPGVLYGLFSLMTSTSVYDPVKSLQFSSWFFGVFALDPFLI